MQVKKEDIRANILSVSENLFIRNGYEDTSLKMIAGKCNISKSNIYRYFSSKEEIYETIVGPARKEILNRSRFFFSEAIIKMSVEDKCREVPLILAEMFSSFHSEILIMLRSESGRDRKMIEDLVSNSFIDTCPIGKSGSREIIFKMLMSGLIDIMTKHPDEKDMLRELRSLICYHYLGLNGLKNLDSM